MAQFLKPSNLNNVWASGGDRIYPGDTKYATGWQVEIPPRQYFNEIDYKQDQMLAHLNQHGIPVWDNETEYQAGKSYIQGSDGVVYKAISTHIGTNPVGAVPGVWEVAFLGSAEAPVAASPAQARAFTDNSVYISPLQLANSFTGTNRSVSGQSGFQVLPGGLILQWSKITISGPTSTTWVFPKAFTSALLNVQMTAVSQAGEQVSAHLYVANSSLVSVTVDNQPGTTNNTCYIFAIGI